MSGRLDGRVAVITGTASGMGRAAAVRFAEEGAVVVGLDVDSAGNAETASAATGFRPVTIDLLDEAAVRAAMAAIGDDHGRIDVLYANAGRTSFRPIADLEYAEWSRVVREELDVTYLSIRAAWPWLRASGNASVILVGSTAGVSGSTSNPRLAHTATKGGIIAMTQQVAAEGAPFGIRANCVSPGIIRTTATEGDLLAPDSPMRDISSAIPLGRLGAPAEVAAAAAFLASDDASYITGANLMVDGGWSAVLPT